jgi:hypothetical protein
VINNRAGGMGLISGRNAFQWPMAEGGELLTAIQDRLSGSAGHDCLGSATKCWRITHARQWEADTAARVVHSLPVYLNDKLSRVR